MSVAVARTCATFGLFGLFTESTSLHAAAAIVAATTTRPVASFLIRIYLYGRSRLAGDNPDVSRKARRLEAGAKTERESTKIGELVRVDAVHRARSGHASRVGDANFRIVAGIVRER